MIKDCRGRENVLVSRKGGDFELRFTDENGKTEFVIWFELKHSAKKHYEKVEELFKELSKHIISRNI